VEETPDHGSDLVKEVESGAGLTLVDGTWFDKESEMGVNFFGRTVSDAPVVHSVSTRPTVAL